MPNIAILPPAFYKAPHGTLYAIYDEGYCMSVHNNPPTVSIIMAPAKDLLRVQDGSVFEWQAITQAEFDDARIAALKLVASGM